MNEHTESQEERWLDKVMNWIIAAGKEGGYVLAGIVAIAAVVLVLGLVALSKFNPVEEAAVGVGQPVAKSVGLIEPKCPGGWSYEGPAADSHVAVSPRCIKDPWIVYLYPNSTECNYGLNTRGADNREVPCSEVPGW